MESGDAAGSAHGGQYAAPGGDATLLLTGVGLGILAFGLIPARRKEEDVEPAKAVGGAPVTQEYADAVGADGYAADASACVKRAKDLLNQKRSKVPA